MGLRHLFKALSDDRRDVARTIITDPDVRLASIALANKVATEIPPFQFVVGILDGGQGGTIHTY
jgi:hypothetical protein